MDIDNFISPLMKTRDLEERITMGLRAFQRNRRAHAPLESRFDPLEPPFERQESSWVSLVTMGTLVRELRCR